ncbi:MAG: hypothetical protein D6753_09755 [Planctomycetota bacterium]|nr:MAG: hypothetical protein D6753_09755 [Planctomycetota bacterium]
MLASRPALLKLSIAALVLGAVGMKVRAEGPFIGTPAREGTVSRVVSLPPVPQRHGRAKSMPQPGTTITEAWRPRVKDGEASLATGPSGTIASGLPRSTSTWVGSADPAPPAGEAARRAIGIVGIRLPPVPVTAREQGPPETTRARLAQLEIATQGGGSPGSGQPAPQPAVPQVDAGSESKIDNALTEGALSNTFRTEARAKEFPEVEEIPARMETAIPNQPGLQAWDLPSATAPARGDDVLKYDEKARPQFIPAPPAPRTVDPRVCPIPYQPGTFGANPLNPHPTDWQQELAVYRGKREVPTQRPLIELWRPLYATGILPAPRPILGPTNLSKPHFYVYGDYRTGIGMNDIGCDDQSLWAFRANLDMDLQLTATERIHAFIGPLDRGGDFTRIELGKNPKFVDRTDLRLDNLFFEGDVGQIWGGLTGTYAPFDLPISFGFLPLFYQNGIWAADNVIGAAVALPSRNSPSLLWSNYDITFFWAADQLNSDAFPGDNNAAEAIGTAWFIDAYDGYIEADYAYVQDDSGLNRSYHNVSLAFARRYWQRVSNTIRYIGNFGQDLPADQRTADGHLLLIENSLISTSPNTVVPYFNAFYGQGRTQSLARAGVAGGILNNTGINFETDGLTGYPTLDPTAVNTAGGATGIQLHSADFRQQFIVEFAGLAALGSPQFRNAAGDQYAVGMRYQRALTNAWLFRTDQMYGWLRSDHDIRGSRFELRWKF